MNMNIIKNHKQKGGVIMKIMIDMKTGLVIVPADLN